MTEDDDATARPSPESHAMFTDLVRVFKLMGATRQHAPRIHPEIEPASYPVLFTLVEGDHRVGTLSERIHSDTSTVSRQVSHLEAVGVVTKHPDPCDRRAFLVTLTDEGRELIARIRVRQGEWMESLLAGWSPDDVTTFHRLLAAFGDTIQNDLDVRRGCQHHSRPAPPTESR